MKKPIFILFMVLIPQLALAEGAWVLWQKTETSEFKNETIDTHYFWKILDAYPLYKECQTAREKVWESEKKQFKKENHLEVSGFPFVVIRNFEKSIWTDVYLCLPEIVNPNLFERRRD